MSQENPFSEILGEWTEVFMHHNFRDFKDFMDQENLSPTQVTTLMRLYHHAGSGVTDIGEFAGVTNPAASQMIERLVQMGFVQRVESQGDRRYKQLTLTQKGEEAVKRGIEARRHWFEKLTCELSATEQDVIAEGLRIMIKAARRMDSDPRGHRLRCEEKRQKSERES